MKKTEEVTLTAIPYGYDATAQQGNTDAFFNFYLY